MTSTGRIGIRRSSSAGTDAAALQAEATAQDTSVWGGKTPRKTSRRRARRASSAPGFTVGRYRPLVHVEDTNVDQENGSNRWPTRAASARPARFPRPGWQTGVDARLADLDRKRTHRACPGAADQTKLNSHNAAVMVMAAASTAAAAARPHTSSWSIRALSAGTAAKGSVRGRQCGLEHLERRHEAQIVPARFAAGICRGIRPISFGGRNRSRAPKSLNKIEPPDAAGGGDSHNNAIDAMPQAVALDFGTAGRQAPYSPCISRPTALIQRSRSFLASACAFSAAISSAIARSSFVPAMNAGSFAAIGRLSDTSIDVSPRKSSIR